ncbi:MAG: family 43 glycosylhydrolase [Bacteroidales bacterium]|nr:family 43 glycosylhydrolase [Bacteroidales bacterium]
MKTTKTLISLFVIVATLAACNKPNTQEHKRPKLGDTFDNPIVHDPVMAVTDSTCYLFSTGMGISVLKSNDLQSWTIQKPCFDTVPEWIKQRIPQATLHFWAPDIIFHNGKWHLFYACSVFGKNTSVIGHATNITLDYESEGYEWKDEGCILQSIPHRDNWNAIDPNIFIDKDSTAWMSFGSFWGGIKLVKLTPDLSAIAEPQEWYTLNSRKQQEFVEDQFAGDGAVEAPFIYYHDDYYYLFTSFDYCCQGKNSTYKVVVGRSKNITGPYVDKNGVRMDLGGGSLLIEGDKVKFEAIGHCAVVRYGDEDLFIAHGYEAEKGTSRLFIRAIEWIDGWPNVTL